MAEKLYRIVPFSDRIKGFDLEEVPDAVVVVRCRDCKHKPHYEGRKAMTDDAEDYTCPYLSGDPWESEVPEDDFFCGYGERRTEQKG